MSLISYSAVGEVVMRGSFLCAVGTSWARSVCRILFIQRCQYSPLAVSRLIIMAIPYRFARFQLGLEFSILEVMISL